MATENRWQEKIISAGYRRLAVRLHPDKGGNAEDMAALNAARDRLLRLARVSDEEFAMGVGTYDPPQPQPARQKAEVKIPNSVVMPPWWPVNATTQRRPTPNDLLEMLRATCSNDPMASALFNAVEAFAKGFTNFKQQRKPKRR
jgi:hypothetical protein